MRLLRAIFGFIIIIAIGKGLWDLGWTLAYEWHRPYVGDNVLFVTMGRAIANGLTPYIDLFENKPPGMFVIAALSLRLFDSIILGRILQILVIIFIPVSTTVCALLLSKKEEDHRERLLFLSSAFLFGVILAVATSKFAGAFYPESFGILFSILYVIWFVCVQHESMTWKAYLLGGILIVAPLGFKEVFLFCLLAIALILSKCNREFLRKFCIPLLIGILFGTVILLISGYLWPYVTSYIPYLIHWHGDLARIINPQRISLWRTGFPTFLLWKQFWFLASPLPFFILFLWGNKLFHAWDSKKENRIIRILIFFFATYLAIFSGQMAGGKAHHIAVILPFLFLLFLFVFPPYAGHHYWWLKGGVTILLCASVFMQSTIFSLADFTEDQKRHLLAKNIAKQLDFILDECDQDRYLRIAVISIPDLLYMHHSPLPSGLIPVRDYENVLIPPFNKMLSNSLLDTNIVFSYKSLGVHPDVKRYLEDHFTKTPWPCAEGKLKFPIDLRLLFRKA